MISEFRKSLRENTADNKTVQIALAIIIIAFLGLSFLISLSQPIDADERFVIDTSENLAKTGKLTTIKPSNILYLKALVYSMPYRIKLTADWDEGRKVIAMRLFGGVIGALVIVITYVMAKQFRPRDKLLLVLSPALLAFNPGYIEAMIKIGGDQIAIFIMAIIFIESTEIITDRSDVSIVDIIIAFIALYVLSRIFPDLALRVGLILIVSSVLISFYLNFRENINAFIKKNITVAIVGGIALVFSIIFFYNQNFVANITLSGIGLFLSKAFFIPQASFTFADFVGGLKLGEGFGYVNIFDRVVITMMFLLSLTGIIGYISEYNLIFNKDKKLTVSDRDDFRINSILLFILFLSVWLLVNNSYIESSYINQIHLGILIIPYFSVIGFGLVKLERWRVSRKAFEPGLIIIFSSYLITILIRLLFRTI